MKRNVFIDRRSTKVILCVLCCAIILKSSRSISLDTNRISHLNKSPPSQSESSQVVSADVSKRAQKICAILEEHTLRRDIDALSVAFEKERILPVSGRDTLIKKLEALIADNKLIRLAFASFPYKSTNTEKKSLGKLPDMAERKAFERLQKIVDQIARIHPPGAKIVLYAEGALFNALVGLSDADLVAYEEALQKIVKDLPGIEILASKEMAGSPAALREAVNRVPITMADLEKKMQKDPKLARGVEILKHRMRLEFDHAKGRKFLEKSSAEAVAKQIELLSQRFGVWSKQKLDTDNTIRASIHFQNDIGKKVSLNLCPGSVVTAWHGVLLVSKDGRYCVIHRQDAPQNAVLTGARINGLWCPFLKV